LNLPDKLSTSDHCSLKGLDLNLHCLLYSMFVVAYLLLVVSPWNIRMEVMLVHRCHECLSRSFINLKWYCICFDEPFYSNIYTNLTRAIIAHSAEGRNCQAGACKTQKGDSLRFVHF